MDHFFPQSSLEEMPTEDLTEAVGYTTLSSSKQFLNDLNDVFFV